MKEGLENEIKETLENGLELASVVSVKRDDYHITVSMRDAANRGLCDAMRGINPKICSIIGCPVCSGIACMIVEGTGRDVRIETVNIEGRTTKVTYLLA
jgi:hypothetical protein